jgi:hypothetical protein
MRSAEKWQWAQSSRFSPRSKSLSLCVRVTIVNPIRKKTEPGGLQQKDA